MASLFEDIVILRWQLAVHLLTCYGIIVMLLALGIRTKCIGNRKFSTALYACVGYLLAQFMVVGAAFANIHIFMSSTTSVLVLVLDFLWSPMLSSICVWLFIAHSVKQCQLCYVDMPRRRIHTRVSYRKIFAYVAIGAMSIVILHPIDIIFDVHADDEILMRILAACAAAGIAGEIFYSRAKFNVISMTSVTWAWFIGTWIGAAILTVI